MLFNSYIFILLFLPVTIAGWYFLHGRKARKAAFVFLLLMSLVFYGYNNVRYVPVIVASILFNYGVSRLLVPGRIAKERVRKTVMGAGVAFNLGLIFYFKYFDFFLENMNTLFHGDFVMRNIALPLGISFFTFQQVSYLVDSYRGETSDYGFIEYAVFVTYFPQLVAGPIVLHDEMIPQFRDPARYRPLAGNMANGLIIFILGLFKKVVIADTFSGAVSWGYANTGILTSGDVFVVMLSYTFQIYFDFSGYCDMACGMARMMNIELPANFDSPYKSFSVREFWKRWHMTLTRFLTRYVYVPLGGNRRGLAGTCVNTMIVFLLSGIWHGANWTFVLWGVLHGLLCVFERLTENRIAKPHPVVKWAGTFFLVNILWMLFRADSVTQWRALLSTLFRMENTAVSGDLLFAFTVPENLVLYGYGPLAFISSKIYGFPVWFLMLAAFLVCLLPENNVRLQKRQRTAAWMVPVCAVAFTWSLLTLSSEAVFLYFNF